MEYQINNRLHKTESPNQTLSLQLQLELWVKTSSWNFIPIQTSATNTYEMY